MNPARAGQQCFRMKADYDISIFPIAVLVRGILWPPAGVVWLILYPGWVSNCWHGSERQADGCDSEGIQVNILESKAGLLVDGPGTNGAVCPPWKKDINISPD